MKKHAKIALAAALLVVTTMAFVLPKISSTKADDVQPMTNLGIREESTLIGTEYSTVTVEPLGQLPGGMSGASLITITSNESTQSFSISFSLGYVSVSVPLNKTQPGYQTAFSVAVPNDGGYYKVYIDQRVQISIFSVNVYKYSELINTYKRSAAKYIDGRVYYKRVN